MLMFCGLHICVCCYALLCRVLTWAQKLMEREYLVGDQLVGKDVASTAAPQVSYLLTAAIYV